MKEGIIDNLFNFRFEKEKCKCGSRAILSGYLGDGRSEYRVKCKKCGRSVSGFGTEREAIWAWNYANAGEHREGIWTRIKILLTSLRRVLST
jgi:hypothetical protein